MIRNFSTGIIFLITLPLIMQSLHADSEQIDIQLWSPEISFNEFADGRRLSVSEVEVVRDNTAVFDLAFQENASSNNHSLPGLLFEMSVVSENVRAYYSLDFKTGLDFEFFHFRTDLGFEFLFNIGDIIFIGPGMNLYYSYFGNNFYFTSTPDFSNEEGEKNELYLIKDDETGRAALYTIGPHIFGTDFTLNLGLQPFSAVRLDLVAGLALAEGNLNTNDRLNNSEGLEQGVSNPGYYIGSRNAIELSRYNVQLTLMPERAGIDFIPFAVGIMTRKNPSIGLAESGWYFRFMFGDFD